MRRTQGPDDGGYFEQTNKAFVFDSRCAGTPLEGFKQGSYMISFEF